MIQQDSSILIIIGAFAVWSLSLIFAASVVGWLYRRTLTRTIGEEKSPPFDLSGTFPHGPELRFVRAEQVAAPTPGSAAAHACGDAYGASARVRQAYGEAWLAYAAVVTVLVAIGMTMQWGWDGKLAVAYFFVVPQLVILIWSMRLPLRWRVVIPALYAAAGVVLLLVVTSHARIPGLVERVGVLFGVVPLVGLAFLFVRRVQPVIILMIASIIHFVGFGLLINWLWPEATQGIRTVHLWTILAGAINISLGVSLAVAILRRGRRVRVLGFAIGVIGSLLLVFDVAHGNLPSVVRDLCFLAEAMLQALVLWLVFRFIVWFQGRRILTNELVQIELCWIFLTLYLVAWMLATPLFLDPTVAGWSLALAVVLSVAVRLTLLFRLRAQRPQRAEKRLLLLRVFGRADKREDLLDDLNDTWRRIGSVDLIAGVDVASRTLQSRMLEAFLLRRSDEQFIRTEDEIERRLEGRRSEIEADARYPENPFYCYQKVWRMVFARLADGAPVVLMDLRGFTSKNQGCMEELTHLLQHIPLHRIVLLCDGRTERQTLEQVARKAWMALPPDSPNLHGPERELTILEFGRKSEKERRALFYLLLRGAFAGE